MNQTQMQMTQIRAQMFNAEVARIPLVNVELSAKLAVKHMPLNDLMFLIAQEVERRAADPGTHCPEGVYGWDDWSADAGRAAGEIKDMARRLEREGLV